MTLKLLFWILFIIFALGAIIDPTPTYPWLNRGRWIVTLILIGILGYVLFDKTPIS